MNLSVSDLLVQSVDEVVADVLGSRVRKSFYDCLMRQRGLSREAVPGHIDDFQQFLEATFGGGSRTLTRCIAKRFFEKLGWAFVEMRQHDLVDYFSQAQRRVEKPRVPNEILLMVPRS